MMVRVRPGVLAEVMEMNRQAVNVKVQQTIRYHQVDEHDQWEYEGPAELLNLATYSRLSYDSQPWGLTFIKWPNEVASPCLPLEIKRQDNRLIFDLKREQLIDYPLEEGSMPLAIRTKVLDYTCSQTQGKILLDYQILMADQILGDYSFRLKYWL